VNESDEEFTVVYPESQEGAARARAYPLRPGGDQRRRPAGGAGDHRDARRGRRPFRDLFDFCERVDLAAVNKGVIEALIKAARSTAPARHAWAWSWLWMMRSKMGKSAALDRERNQPTLFGADEAPPPPKISQEEWPDTMLLEREKAALGFYVTKHPPRTA
jgi:DNA polymerase-3 subunit alpha